jgi:predicted transcriptional regulator
MVSKKEIEKIDKKVREDITVKQIMQKRFQTAIPQEYLFSAIQKLNSNPVQIVPVIDPIDSRIIGTISPAGVVKLLETKEAENSS